MKTMRIQDDARCAKLFLLLLLVSAPWTINADDSSSSTADPSPATVPVDEASTVPDGTASDSTITEAPPTDAPTTPPAPPPPPTKYEPYDFSEQLSELRGSYALKFMTHDQERPGWASIWPVNSAERSFGVYFWPPKYCHAIYLCAVKSKIYDGKQRFDEFDCDTSYVKFYPHIRKIHFKADANAEEVEKFYVEGSLEFQQNAQGNYIIRVFNEEPTDENKWMEMLKDSSMYSDLEWSLADKDLLILTNSRMCEVNKPGMGDFAPIFTAENSPSHKDKWPKWLPDGSKKDGDPIPTISIASTANSTKTVDLLAFLKDLTIENQLAQIKQQCSNYEKVGVFGSRKPVHEHSPFISTATYHLFQPALRVVGGYVQKIEFEMSNCQWIRFWASDSPITDYATAMKPEDTLDFFIEEGFYIPPDSNEPVALPDAQLMNKLKLTILNEPDVSMGDDHELIEIAFGYVNEKYLFHQFFRSKNFGKKNFKLHMIRSPRCDSNIVIDGGYRDLSSPGVVNLKDVEQCEFNYLNWPPQTTN